jgi:MoaA/NifB/PqqE/SkfB family radical SAM enzyme
MNIDQIKSMAKNLAEIGVCIVLLIGGEPFVRKDIVEIVSSFTENGIHVRLQTNGLSQKETLKRCIDAGAHDISISLDTLSQDIQDTINGNFQHSWKRTIESVANVNEVFPLNGTAFFGTVLMPRNINHIKDVIEFATAIGWGVSLVPAHVSTPDQPRGFRTFDDKNVCRFPEYTYPRVREVLEDVKRLRKKGFNVYDSDEYLDDIYRFIVGEPIRWRRRNDNVCDSPNLYFAVEPNGNINPCCDFKLKDFYPVYHKKFPEWYRKGLIHRDIYDYTRNCSGCMYGSYPEITITARFLIPMIRRFLYFNKTAPKLKKISSSEMIDIAGYIFDKNLVEREAAELKLQRFQSTLQQ